jgi:HD-GYP domain-containing protein (c-di-GMP phosphodiesterase class II)
LTKEEWLKMKEHPALGEQILRGIGFLKEAVCVVAQHHEQWNGTGYPAGLRGEAIDFNARIFAVADAFDAMTTDRVYRVGRSYEMAVAELDDFVGRQFDSTVVAAFHRVPKEEWIELSQANYPKPAQSSDALGYGSPQNVLAG